MNTNDLWYYRRFGRRFEGPSGWARLEQALEGKRIVEGQDLRARVVLADRGVGDVADGEAEAGRIVEAPGELELGAELEHRAQVSLPPPSW